MDPSTDTINLAEVGRALRRGRLHILAGLAVGLLAAAAVLLFVRRKFDATGTVLLRSAAPETGSSLLAGANIPEALLPSGLTSSLRSDFETESAILSSRAVIGRVVDSLGLQARLLGPAAIPSDAFLAPAVYPGLFKRRVYHFDRRGAGAYGVRGPGTTATAHAGRPVALPGIGTLTLQDTTLPASFTVEILDREDAVTRVEKALAVAKAGGDVARLSFRWTDSVTAAAVPNAAIAIYLSRRKTVDRGINQRRLEFLVGFSDTVTQRLAAADDRLRRFEEASGVLDPELVGKTQIGRAMALRQQLEGTAVEETAVNHILAQVRSGALSPTQLAAYPTFLKSPAINDLLSQMATLETQRLQLVVRRTEQDPEVQALEASIKNLQDQLDPLATAYAAALARQRQTLAFQLDTVQQALAALPGQTQTSVELERQVKSLTATFLGLQSQIVDARLAAITEGGLVRQIDVAEAPRKAAFPRPAPTILAGAAGGLLLGLLAALWTAYLGRWIRTPEDVERMVGIPALALDSGAPLLMGGLAAARSLLVVPLGHGADTIGVARRLASTARERETDAAVAEVATNGGPVIQVRPAVRQLEGSHGVVIVPVPRLDDPRTAALLEETRPVLFVARSGHVARRDLIAAVETLRRLGIPCSGVVLHGAVAVAAAPDPAGGTTPASLPRKLGSGAGPDDGSSG